jgi:hypothetical protein
MRSSGQYRLFPWLSLRNSRPLPSAVMIVHRRTDWALFANAITGSCTSTACSSRTKTPTFPTIRTWWPYSGRAWKRNLVHNVTGNDRDREIVGSPEGRWKSSAMVRWQRTRGSCVVRITRRAFANTGSSMRRGDDISFIVLNWRKSGHAAAPYEDAWVRSRVFERHFRFSRERNRRGAWTETLEVN